MDEDSIEESHPTNEDVEPIPDDLKEKARKKPNINKIDLVTLNMYDLLLEESDEDKVWIGYISEIGMRLGTNSSITSTAKRALEDLKVIETLQQGRNHQASILKICGEKPDVEDFSELRKSTKKSKQSKAQILESLIGDLNTRITVLEQQMIRQTKELDARIKKLEHLTKESK